MSENADTQTLSPFVRFLQGITGPWTRRNLLSWFFLIAGILFIKGCVIDQYTVPTGSMEPTIHGDPRFFRGDRVVVNKWVYGPRIPFTTIRLWDWGGPKRWDIVVFRRPSGPGPKTLVKRVAALPGEHVQIKDGALYINGQRTEPPAEFRDIIHYTTAFGLSKQQEKTLFLKLAQSGEPLMLLNPPSDEGLQLYRDINQWRDRVAAVDIEKLTPEAVDALCQGVSPKSFEVIERLNSIQQPPLKYGVRPEPEFSQVPEGHYLLLGDNSPQSLDGRVWGWVPKENLYGRAFGIWWPLNHRRDFSGFSHTWWGALLLYGIPALLGALELRHYLRERKRSA